jgi:hypothetical protein
LFGGARFSLGHHLEKLEPVGDGKTNAVGGINVEGRIGTCMLRTCTTTTYERLNSTTGKSVSRDSTRMRDGQEPAGFALVPETVQVIRVEFLQQMLRARIEVQKTNKIRG